MYTHEKQFIQAGKAATHAEKAVMLLHGRGSTAQSILTLQQHLHLDDALLIAPQATNNSWYPYTFLAPVPNNQPALDSAITLVGEMVSEAAKQGFAEHQLYFVGFSQGACLALEYAGRHAKHYGGIVAFTGGLIGPALDPSNYHGDFAGTPVLITGGDQDPHVPLLRMKGSASLFETLGANVKLQIYPDKPHSISADETLLANEFVFT